MTERMRGEAGKRQRQRRLEANPFCADCKAEGKWIAATEVDHIVPLSQGGSDRDANTRNLCRHHHLARTAEQFGHRPRSAGCDASGRPLDPNHPWNRS